MLLVIGPVLAATLKVGPSEAYTTINAAVSAAADGDTITVAAGTYTEDLDLRGRDLNVVGAGPYVTRLESTQPLYIQDGSFESFHFHTTNQTGIYIDAGAPTIREVEVDASSTKNGIWISAGTPTIEECLVVDSLRSGVVSTGGSPVVRRTVSVDSANYNFWFKGTPTLQNSLSIGSPYGITANTIGTWEHNVVLGATDAIYTVIANTFLDGVYAGNTFVVECKGGEPTFSGGIGYAAYAAKGCGATALSGLTDADPEFSEWAAGSSLYELDLMPASGSPMVDAGTGLDVDGTRADLGIFGGIQGAWRDRDGDGVVVVFDCDDHSAARHPGAIERADGEDQDCDGLIDEDVPVDTGDTGDTGTVDTDTGTDTGTSGTADVDHDGYPASVDCGDHNIRTYPGAPELYDSVDNDCDGRVDEGTFGGDNDGDGYTIVAGDCDDTDPATHPDATDVIRNAIDEDCNGADASPKHQDNDDDGVTDDTDCDDTDPDTYPGAGDPTDGKDNDCNGVADDVELTTDGDGDGVAPGEGDCDDDDAAFHPGAVDIADDYIDQDCTGEDNYDVDRDGYASPASGGEDCDDLRSTTWPGAEENCDDGIDNNCDGEADEDCGGSADDGGGGDCGCAAGSAAGGAAFLLALAPLILRRRSINS